MQDETIHPRNSTERTSPICGRTRALFRHQSRSWCETSGGHVRREYHRLDGTARSPQGLRAIGRVICQMAGGNRHWRCASDLRVRASERTRAGALCRARSRALPGTHRRTWRHSRAVDATGYWQEIQGTIGSQSRSPHGVGVRAAGEGGGLQKPRRRMECRGKEIVTNTTKTKKINLHVPPGRHRPAA